MVEIAYRKTKNRDALLISRFFWVLEESAFPDIESDMNNLVVNDRSFN